MNNAKYLHYALFAMVLLGTVQQTLSSYDETPSGDEAQAPALLFADYDTLGQFYQEQEQVPEPTGKGLDLEDFEMDFEDFPRGLLRQERRNQRPRLLEQLEQQREEQQRQAQLQYQEQQCQEKLKPLYEERQDPLEYRGEWKPTLRSEKEQLLELKHQEELRNLRERQESLRYH